MKRSLLLALAFTLASTAVIAQADVKLAACFGDHMVLQRETKAPIWGTASPGEKVTVKFGDQEQSTKADADGKWQVELVGLKLGAPGELTVTGKNKLTIKDVLVGEVWVGSGQSNMAGNVGGYAKNDPVLAKLAAQEFQEIRGYHPTYGWLVATPANNPKFSAILFGFAVRLNEELKTPVGMLLGAVGGTPSGAWVSGDAVAADAASQKLIAEYATKYDEVKKDYETRLLPKYEKEAAIAKAAGKELRGRLRAPAKPGTVNDQPFGYLYDKHIRPFLGYGIRGVLWDQGEAGTAVGGVDQYTMMGALIRGWRKEWKVGEFPFVYVQKPSGGGCAWDNANPVTSQGEAFKPLPAAVPTDGIYVETHVKIMEYPKVGMATSSDLGPMTHPTNKSGYGSRAADVALGLAYDKPVEAYGPKYASHTIEGNKVRVKFTHVVKGLAWKHGDKLQGFALAGDDKVFQWADATIDGDTVVLSSDKISKPVAVRYAFARDRTWANLFNKDGLPALTFRTDDWPAR